MKTKHEKPYLVGFFYEISNGGYLLIIFKERCHIKTNILHEYAFDGFLL
jgi:hypothetical protein